MISRELFCWRRAVYVHREYFEIIPVYVRVPVLYTAKIFFYILQISSAIHSWMWHRSNYYYCIYYLISPVKHFCIHVMFTRFFDYIDKLLFLNIEKLDFYFYFLEDN